METVQKETNLVKMRVAVAGALINKLKHTTMIHRTFATFPMYLQFIPETRPHCQWGSVAKGDDNERGVRSPHRYAIKINQLLPRTRGRNILITIAETLFYLCNWHC